jgi:uncharacterized coiled-coil protein SlyX
MSLFERLFGGNTARINALEKRVAVLEHNVTLMVRALQGTNSAIEKMAEALQALDAEQRNSHHKGNVNVKSNKKEYIN